jgi:hypothetical protein
MHRTGNKGEAQSVRWVGKRQRSARAGVTEGCRAGAVDTMLVGHEPAGERSPVDENAVGSAAQGGRHRGKRFFTIKMPLLSIMFPIFPRQSVKIETIMQQILNKNIGIRDLNRLKMNQSPQYRY